jgi:hypothetical protein
MKSSLARKRRKIDDVQVDMEERFAEIVEEWIQNTFE